MTVNELLKQLRRAQRDGRGTQKVFVHRDGDEWGTDADEVKLYHGYKFGHVAIVGRNSFQIHNEYWARVQKPHDEQEFLEIGAWLDRGTNEVLLVHLPTREVYRKRYWRSGFIGDGEVWFKLECQWPLHAP